MSVAKITPKVRKISRSRSGKGAPPCVVSGSASAAASETAPRIPAHATTKRRAGPTRRSRWLGRRSMARIR